MYSVFRVESKHVESKIGSVTYDVFISDFANDSRHVNRCNHGLIYISQC